VGSTIKPLLYSLAIEEAGFTPNTIVQDVQQNFDGYGMVPNTPKTCTFQSIPMAQALAESRNCSSAYIMKQINGNGNEAAKQFVEYLKKCNIKSDIQPYPSIALGAVEISLFEMVQAYTMFPGGGYNAQPFFINRIESISQRANIEFWQSHSKEDAYKITYHYKSYGNFFYGEVTPQANKNYTDEAWLLKGKIDKPVYISCKVNGKNDFESEVKDAQFLYNKNGFYFYKRSPLP
jgi:membrane peptidoglycan carboxypeptidase